MKRAMHLKWAVRWMYISALLIAAQARAEDAMIRIHADQRAAFPIPKYITGKFAEHLGSNIYNGMSAQIVRNPTFAEYPFWTGAADPDGRTRFHSDDERITGEIRRLAGRLNWPDADIRNLIESRADGMAFWWIRIGTRGQVIVSPDTNARSGRAQRIQTTGADQGIGQWMYLPLHRVRKYEYRLIVRSPDLRELKVRLSTHGAESSAMVTDVSARWATFTGTLEVRNDAPAETLYRLDLVSPSPGQFVVDRLLLYPADHVNGADPDVVRLLKESRLPILRWPGGNFVSGYHWRDGVGPADQRPTRPNWAWGGVEPNLFGTDEFIQFCRDVGAEPMICINGGDGTPAEAARWIEYCNGPADSPMGALRAKNGHPQPYNVRHWEAGNELWGKWQVHWTTPAGYADRYRQFSRAMLKADPTIRLYACGAPVLWGREWNQTLFTSAGPLVQCTTDHPLIGGDVPGDTEPLDVYRDFMAVPNILESKWAELRDSMSKAGIEPPRLAVTELQLFAHLGGTPAGKTAKLNYRNLVNPSTHAEALYDTLIYHSAIRLAPFVEMVTHSATVNHGGGLRKERERVYANPCYLAQSAFAAFAGATPVKIELQSPTAVAPAVLPDTRGPARGLKYEQIAALAAVDPRNQLLVSIVHRGTDGPIQLKLDFSGFKGAEEAELWQLSADVPWAANSLENPQRVKPVISNVPVRGSSLNLDVPPFTVLRLRIPPAR